MQRLREEAAGESLLALERLVRQPAEGAHAARRDGPREARAGGRTTAAGDR